MSAWPDKPNTRDVAVPRFVCPARQTQLWTRGVARDLSHGIQLDKKCPVVRLVVKLGTWVEVMREKYEMSAGVARDLSLGIQLDKKCPVVGWLSKLTWVEVIRGKCGVATGVARDLTLGIQLDKKCPVVGLVVKIDTWVEVMRGSAK